MLFEKRNLLEFLEEVDGKLEKKVSVVAVGGTAMTLLDIKKSTIDIDFMVASGEAEFREALSSVPHGYRIDIFPEGIVFSQKLPDDYDRKIILIKEFRNMMLYALHPIDIIVTKIGRLDERDIQDIKDCIRKFGIKKQEIRKRAKLVEYIGKEENYETNLNFVLKNIIK